MYQEYIKEEEGECRTAYMPRETTLRTVHDLYNDIHVWWSPWNVNITVQGHAVRVVPRARTRATYNYKRMRISAIAWAYCTNHVYLVWLLKWIIIWALMCLMTSPWLPVTLMRRQKAAALSVKTSSQGVQGCQ